MRILHEALSTVAASDIAQLCSDQIPESTELELKSDLPSKSGRGDPWHGGAGIGEYARNEIAEEIIAFANSFGGAVCVGINETADHPKRADSPHPLPRVHELARRLRQAVYDIIDPPLPALEATGVEIGPTGAGVVILRVPPSRRRPHRHQVSKEVFVRRSDESVRITMREIQELTIQAIAEATRVEDLIEERRQTFRDQTSDWLKPTGEGENMWGGGLHFVGMPTTMIDLGRVVGRPRLIYFEPKLEARFSTRTVPCIWPHSRMINWRPGLRCMVAEVFTHERKLNTQYSLNTNGVCEMSFRFQASDDRPGLFIGWLVGALCFMLTWIDRIRNESGSATEFALAPQLFLAGQARLYRYGATSFADDGGTLPYGSYEFPVMSIGPKEEFESHIQHFDEDLSNLTGYDNQSSAPTFALTLPP
jgi:hypothetical protein